MSKEPKHHGMSMSAASRSGSGGDGDRPPKRPSGTAYPAVSPIEEVEEEETIVEGGSTEEEEALAETSVDKEDSTGSVSIVQPMPVVLTIGTIIKLALTIIVPILGLVSTGIYFFHKTNLHIDDPTVHLTRGERATLETKAEAAVARKKMEKSITRELTVKTRELKQDLGDQQVKQFKKLGRELKTDQKYRFDQLMKEIQQTRRAFKPQP